MSKRKLSFKQKINFMEDTIEKVTNLPAPLMLALVVWIFGLCIRKIKLIPNRYIPLILCSIATVIYPFISSDERVGFTYVSTEIMFYLKGFAIGAIAVAANEILKNMPIIGSFFEKIQNAFNSSGNGDTTITKKPENYESKINPPSNPNS